MDFPVVQDPITVMGTHVVPLAITIDEHGIVRSTRPRTSSFATSFLNKKFKDDAPKMKSNSPTPILNNGSPNYELLAKNKDWKSLGDAHVLWGGPKKINAAIEAYSKAQKQSPKDGSIAFRLGVCYRRRYEELGQQSDDFQKAVDHWGQALSANPNQYIWRRRIQQYGPRLDKPYPFYDWVSQAIKDVKARGEKPIELKVPLIGAEIARPSRRFSTEETAKNPDPQGKINRDKDLILTEVTVVPGKVRAGRSLRAHVSFYPNAKRKGHWNNEGEPLKFWIDVPEGWKVSRQLVSISQPKKATSNEKRFVDFEIQVPRSAKGKHRLKGYGLYNVCEDVDGTCLYLRKNVEIMIDVR